MKLIMNKTGFYRILCAMLMLGSTIELKPMFTMQFLKSAQSAITRTANIGPWILTVGGSMSYIGAHFVQLKRIITIKEACIKAPENTRQDYNRLLDQSNLPILYTIYNNPILECMKNTPKNLKNYNYCVDLAHQRDCWRTSTFYGRPK